MNGSASNCERIQNCPDTDVGDGDVKILISVLVDAVINVDKNCLFLPIAIFHFHKEVAFSSYRDLCVYRDSRQARKLREDRRKVMILIIIWMVTMMMMMIDLMMVVMMIVLMMTVMMTIILMMMKRTRC